MHALNLGDFDGVVCELSNSGCGFEMELQLHVLITAGTQKAEAVSAPFFNAAF